jgi:hypothetical protein
MNSGYIIPGFILAARFVCSIVAWTLWAPLRRKKQIGENNRGEDHPSQALSRRHLLDTDAAKRRVESMGKYHGRQ